MSLQTELSYVQAHLATLELPQPPPAPVTSSGSPPPLSILDLPTITPSLYELSPIFEPMSSTWTMQQQPRPFDHLFDVPSSSTIGGSSELQALARDFLHGGQIPADLPPPGTGGSAPTVVKREWYYLYVLVNLDLYLAICFFLLYVFILDRIRILIAGWRVNIRTTILHLLEFLINIYCTSTFLQRYYIFSNNHLTK